MKKYRIMLICVTAAVIVLTAFFTYAYLHNKYSFRQSGDSVPRTEYVLSERETLMFFRMTPEQFMNSSLIIYDHVEDFRKRSSLGPDGTLILRLSDDQKRGLSEMLYSGLDGYTNVKGIDVSADFRRLTFTGNKDEMKYALAHKYDPYTLEDMALRQLFAGVAPSEIKVVVIYRESEGSEPLHTLVWPEEKIIYQTDGLFS